jgi:hypothetical protein
VQELDRAHVHTRVGCEATSSFSGRDSSRATTTFCWLPPDRRGDRQFEASVRMSNSSTRASRVLGDLVGPQCQPVAERRLAEQVEDQVLARP